MSRNQNEIDRTLAGGMTVAQLIEGARRHARGRHRGLRQRLRRHLPYRAGLGGPQVEELDVETERLETSAYSHSGIAIEPIVDATEADDAEASVAEDANHVVILRS